MKLFATSARRGLPTGSREIIDITASTRFQIYRLTERQKQLNLLVVFSQYRIGLKEEAYAALRSLIEIYDDANNRVVVKIDESDAGSFSALKAAAPPLLLADEKVFEKYQDAAIDDEPPDMGASVTNHFIDRSRNRRTHRRQDKVGAVIVCRCSSSRLPGKATMKINGQETIRLLIERLKLANNLDEIVLATSTEETDDALEVVAADAAVSFFRGPLEDVAQRMILAAREFELESIVRITGDDILRDETMVDEIVDHHRSFDYDITKTDNMPEGTSSEVFDLPVLEVIWQKAFDRGATGQLDWFLSNGHHFDIKKIESDYEFDPRIRLTLDYEEDLRLLTVLFDHFRGRGVRFTLRETLEYIRSHETIIETNAFKLPAIDQADVDCRLRI